MNFFRTLLLLLLLISGQSALAGDKVILKPAPKWAEIADLEKILAENEKSSAFFVILDRQVKIEDGESLSFADIALRASSEKMIPAIANMIKGNWQPTRGDFIVHTLEIHRDGKIIDVLKDGSPFEVIRREKMLERQMLNGVLTATTQLEDLQVGDIVRFSSTTRSRNPSLGGKAETGAGLIKKALTADHNQLRLLWPESEYLNWKATGKDVETKLTKTNGYNDLRMDFFYPEQDKMPSDAPRRFRQRPMLTASGFKDWAEVSKTASLEYQTDGLIAADKALAAEVEKIRNASSDPLVRAAQSLRLVQDKVRYLYNGLGFGNYRPQTPKETWELRYGDCKAKTLLLLAILHELDIDAVPVLTATRMRDGVSRYIPSFQAFDHIFVRAQVGDKTLWMDGTGQGARIFDLEDVPRHRYVLPVTDEGADLLPLEIRKPARPFQTMNVHYDASAGLGLPALVDVELTLRDSDATGLKSAKATLNEKEFRKKLNGVAAKYFIGSIVTDSEFSYDDARSEGTVKAKGLSYLNWTKKAGQYELRLSSWPDNWKIGAKRNKPEWREIPVALGFPYHMDSEVKVTLPRGGTGFALDGTKAIDQVIKGRQVHRAAAIDGATITMDENYFSKAWELEASQIAIERRKISRLKRKKLLVKAPATYPEPWQDTLAAVKDKRIATLRAAFDKLVANEPDEELPYQRRAYFFQKIQDYKAAIADLTKSLEIKQEIAVLRRRSYVYEAMNQRDKAIADLEAALKIDAAQSNSIGKLVQLNLYKKDLKRVAELIDTAEENGQSEYSLAYWRATLLVAQGNTEAAFDDLDELIEDDPENAIMLNARCWLKGLAKFELEDALEDCSQAIQLSKKPAGILDSRALVHFRLGDYDNAQKDLAAALKINHREAAAHYLLGLVYSKLGKAKESKHEIATAKSINRNIANLYDHHGLKP